MGFIKLRRFILLLLGLLLTLTTTDRADAHGYIVRAIPQDRAALDRSPVRVQYWFSEALERDFSTISVRDSAGNLIASGGVDPDDPTLLTARLPTGLPDGAYVSELRIAFRSDGHLVVDTRTFFVGQDADAAFGIGGSTDTVAPLEAVWRSMVTVAHMLLFGAFTLYALVLVPAWGNDQHPAGLLPPRVMRRLYQIVIFALIAALLGNGLALIQQTMVFFSADIGRVLSDGLWNTVRISTRFGDTWNARVLLTALVAVMIGASWILRREQPGAVRAYWTASAWAMALGLGTMSIASHAAGSLMLPWVAMFSDWLHSAATGFWAGALTVLVLILPAALRSLTGDDRRLALLAALRRFSPIAAAGVVVVISTGIYSTLNWFTEPNDLATIYAGTLAIKLMLAALLIGVGAIHFAALRPDRFASAARLMRRMGGFIPSLRIEAALVIAVLISVAWLSAAPVPTPDLAGQTLPAPTDSQTVGAYTITTTITPGGPGVNTYDVLVTDAAGYPVDGLAVALQMSDPAADWRGDLHTMEAVGDGLYVSAGDEIAQPGVWWTTVDLAATRAAYAWTISQDAAVLQARPLGVLNALALIGVVGAAGFALSPLILRFVRRLDFSPAVITVAGGAIVALIALIVVTGAILQQSDAQYAAALNPPPEVVNPTLPTADSLDRGADQFAACGWEAAPDLSELIERLPRTRDEVLYGYTQAGWRGLPPCPALSEMERWDMVNYVRSQVVVRAS